MFIKRSDLLKNMGIMLTTLLTLPSSSTWEEIRKEILNAIHTVQGKKRSLEESTQEHAQEKQDFEHLKSVLETVLKKNKKEEPSEKKKTTKEEPITQPRLREKFVDGIYESGYRLDQGESFSYTSQFGKSYYEGTTQKPAKIVYAQEGETFTNQDWEKYLNEKKMENLMRINRTYSDALPRMLHIGTEEEQLRTFLSKITWRHSWNKVK